MMSTDGYLPEDLVLAAGGEEIDFMGTFRTCLRDRPNTRM